MNALTPLRSFIFTEKPVPSKNLGERGRLEWIPVSKLRIDRTYQREVNARGRGNIKKIIAGFNWSLFSPVVVAERPGGTYAVIDGQHRSIAAAMHGQVKELPCLVIMGDAAIEARAFATINGQVTAVLATQLHYARVAAGDEKASLIDEVCKEAGATVLRTPPGRAYRVGETFAVGALAYMLKLYGRLTVRTAIELVTRTGDGHAGYLRAPIIVGMCITLAANPKWSQHPGLLKAVENADLRKMWQTANLKRAENGGSLKVHFSQALSAALLASLGDGGATEKAAAASTPKRRFNDTKPLKPEAVEGLSADHPAVKESRTLFPRSVVDVKDSPRLFVSGEHSHKLGGSVTKGPWKSFPIYQLTLEERATCPKSCHHWLSCYGNSSPHARRHRNGPDLVPRLTAELVELQANHPKGFVVRLHVLGDFFSVDYVGAWAGFLSGFPALHVFGYTAWPKDSAIGAAIKRITDKQWSRFAIRFSAEESQTQGATTIWRVPEDDRVKEGLVCPAQAGKTDCCGSCGLCWSEAAKNETIAFVAHGGINKGAVAAEKAKAAKRNAAVERKIAEQQATPPIVKTKTPPPKPARPKPAKVIIPDAPVETVEEFAIGDRPAKVKPKFVPSRPAGSRSRIERKSARDQAAAAVAEFLKKGGQVRRIEAGASGDMFLLRDYLERRGIAIGMRGSNIKLGRRIITREQVIALVDKERAKEGLPPLTKRSA